jgi:hypothetical protein
MPTMTQVIKLGVYDHDPEKSELIGNIIERLNRVKKANMQTLDTQVSHMITSFPSPHHILTHLLVV